MDEPLIVDLKFLGIVFVVSSVVLHWLFVYAWVSVSPDVSFSRFT
jgi:hypothetical protein